MYYEASIGEGERRKGERRGSGSGSGLRQGRWRVPTASSAVPARMRHQEGVVVNAMPAGGCENLGYFDVGAQQLVVQWWCNDGLRARN